MMLEGLDPDPLWSSGGWSTQKSQSHFASFDITPCNHLCVLFCALAGSPVAGWRREAPGPKNSQTSRGVPTVN